ncbi:hypothetical protein BDD12DRAFT_782774, partial [Trichophaea hybrida]
MGNNINASMKMAYPSGEKPYSKATVLFIKWDNDDLNVGPSEDKLKRVFRMIYGFSVQEFIIPSTKDSNFAELNTSKALVNFVLDNDAEQALLVLVYNGHSLGDKFDCKWSGSLSSAVQVDWMSARVPLNLTQADVMIILDCCYASAAAIDSRIELLAASSRESQASSDPKHNLTRTVAKILKHSGSKPMTVAQIHAKIVREAKSDLLPVTPVHAELGAKLTGSIVLARLGETVTNIALPALATIRVLVTAKLQDPTILPDIDQWQQFLTSAIPSNVQEMNV